MKKRKRIIIFIVAAVAVAVMAATGGSFYMLSYSLTPDPNRRDVDSAMQVMFSRAPFMKEWTDSVRAHRLLRDTFIMADDGRRLHAVYMRNGMAHGRTAVIVHGYKDCYATFLYLGRMYHEQMGCNILLPDLHAHGLSGGGSIQMGWKDRNDVKRWAEVAEETFRDRETKSSVVIHGVSMGAATTMCVAGDSLPDYVRCFVEDCGYTSVWDEFGKELAEKFSLPAFPLMYTTSTLCKLRNGWSFGEASPLRQVSKCLRPMLFIHGDKDSFVPTWMVYKLYAAKPSPKELWIAPGTKHARAYLDHPKEYTARVTAFLAEAMGE
ncbi:MAG: alpha/beta hydrolase [Bacteroidales bacterium]|nr:alpha/beta hydrolase [Bacteroidales bacterium]MCM1146550.1 alpha/beta hydrolase [Bacteroidales bacterium]MCM1205942.1 alpha/beta hydrolase [Bacillota bacterium]MCM1510180.1 alpha/beta hydrolase [Clostridium sp.]